MSPNRKAFLDMIAWSEIGKSLLSVSDNGYNVIVGGSVFGSYADHPRRLIELKDRHGMPIMTKAGITLKSTAAGRYQLLARYYDDYKRLLGLKDFSPAAQDAIAIQQIKECRALDDVDAGRFKQAVKKVAHIWASLPGAGYGQHENDIALLQAVYEGSGGQLA